MLHSSTARFSHRPSHFAISVSFSTICHVTSRKLRLPQCIMGDDLHIWSYLVQNERGRTWHMLFLKPVGNTAIECFLSNTFCIISFCSELSCRWNCLSCRIRFILSSMWFVCCLPMQIIWRAALSSSHHAMCCCHHSVSIARSRLLVRKRNWNGDMIGSMWKSSCTRGKMVRNE